MNEIPAWLGLIVAALTAFNTVILLQVDKKLLNYKIWTMENFVRKKGDTVEKD